MNNHTPPSDDQNWQLIYLSDSATKKIQEIETINQQNHIMIDKKGLISLLLSQLDSKALQECLIIGELNEFKQKYPHFPESEYQQIEQKIRQKVVNAYVNITM